MNAFKLAFLAKAYFKRSVKIPEAIVFLVNPYYLVLPYLILHNSESSVIIIIAYMNFFQSLRLAYIYS